MRLMTTLVQSLGMLLAQFVLHIHLPYRTLFGIMGIQSLLSLIAIYQSQFKENINTSTHAFFAQLALDSLALTAWLYYSGGSTNPFVAFYLPLIAVAATILPWRFSVFIFIMCLLGYSFLNQNYVPIDILDEEKAVSYHLSGMWINFIASAALISFFVSRMSQTLRIREQELADAREQHLRNETIIALGMQAAYAAHEMGTPLSTILMLTEEFQHACQTNTYLRAYQADFETINQQIKLCKHALDKMVIQHEALSEPDLLPTWTTWLTEWVERWRVRAPSVNIELESAPACQNLTIIHAKEIGEILMIFLDNAVRASINHNAHTIYLNLAIKQIGALAELTLSVTDEGEGIPPSIAQDLGKIPVISSTGGQGIGLFLAATQAKKINGTITLTHRHPHGTCVTLSIPVAPPPSFSHS